MSEQSGAWQADPFGRHQYRWWNGSEWTDQVADDGVTSVDPATAEGAAAAADGSPPGEVPPGDATTPGAEAGDPTQPIGAVPGEVPPPTATGWGAPQAPDATAAMPAAPAPGPSAPVEEQPTKRLSGNAPALILGGILLLALIGAAAWLLLGGDDDEVSREELVAALSSGDIDESEAGCMIDRLEGSIGLDRLAEIDRDASVATESEEAQIQDARGRCTGSDEEAAGDDAADDDADEDEGSEGDDGSEVIDPEDAEALAMQMFGNLDEEQVQCLGEEIAALEEDYDFEALAEDPTAGAFDPEMIQAFMAAFTDCDIPLESLFAGIDPGDLEGGETGFLPGDTYGDNPELDALWDACEDGDGEACDELYFSSEVGSEYEEFGDTCGGRFEAGEVLCAMEDLG